MEKIERLRSIVESNQVTADDKKFIEDESKELNLEFNPKSTKCKDCYIDQAVIIYHELTKGIKSECHSRLRDDIDVIINGVRINNATLTDELVERYRGKGLPEHWFV